MDRITAAGQWRAPRELDGGGAVGRLADGSEVVQFASNDYLGLTQHPRVLGAAHAALDRWGAGSGAARRPGRGRRRVLPSGGRADRSSACSWCLSL